MIEFWTLTGVTFGVMAGWFVGSVVAEVRRLRRAARVRRASRLLTVNIMRDRMGLRPLTHDEFLRIAAGKVTEVN